MLETLKELLAMGFTPAAAVCMLAVGVIWLRLRWSEKQNSKIREKWHAETHARVDDLEKHTEECNADRDNLKREAILLKVKVGLLAGRVKRMTRCPKQDCPFRE